METIIPVTVATLARRIRVALGQEPADVVLKGGQVVDVFTQTVRPANVAMVDGVIAGVGPYEWHATQTWDITGQFVLPGLIDAHIHVESTLLMPGELARLIVPRGTLTLIADPHEIANVMGVKGIELLIDASRDLPLDLFFMASSCVPASRWEESGAFLEAEDIQILLQRPEILGLAEMMNYPAILHGEAKVLDKVVKVWNLRRAVDGHAPLLSGRELQAYVAAGMRSDHESSQIEEARAKAELGMMIQVREGSAEHNLHDLMPLILEDRIGDWCLASDDLFPNDLVAHGHLDRLLRQLVEAGVPPARAVRHASLIPARHYGLHDRGAVAPSYRADLWVVKDLQSFTPKLVFKHGQCVAQEGRYWGQGAAKSQTWQNTINLPPLSEEHFVCRLRSTQAPVIGIIPGQIITRHEVHDIPQAQGCFQFNPAVDIQLMANIERHGQSGKLGLGFVRGFGLRRRGAMATSVGHDAHNVIVMGTDPASMLAATRALEEMGGGFVVVDGVNLAARLRLPVAGLLTDEPAHQVCEHLEELHRASSALGCPLPSPFGILSFMALSVIPELRITTHGILDVMQQRIVSI